MSEHPVRLRELPDHEKPRERLIALGATALSDAELIAILLRVGIAGASATAIAQQLLRDVGSWDGLQRISVAELARKRGLGSAKAAQLKAALEIGRRLTLHAAQERPQIRNAADAAQLVQLEMSHLDQEQLRTICLDTRNRVLRIQTVYVGSLHSSVVRIGEICATCQAA
jgi:DNA repair protein RadC